MKYWRWSKIDYTLVLTSKVGRLAQKFGIPQKVVTNANLQDKSHLINLSTIVRFFIFLFFKIFPYKYTKVMYVCLEVCVYIYIYT